MKVLVTGATGFVGKTLIPELQRAGHALVLPVRQKLSVVSGINAVYVADFYDQDSWGQLLEGVDVVIHMAGRAHVLKEQSGDPAALFHQANVELSLLIARQAAVAGVKRFIFLSSIGVNGNHSELPFRATDVPQPQELYAKSKLEAEQQLQILCQHASMELVIVRPPLVYGPEAPGNFGRLVRIVARGWPLPFGAVHNQRSFVSVYNLSSLLLCCLTHSSAAGQVLLVSDNDDISTSDLLRLMAKLQHKNLTLLPVPTTLLRLGCRLTGFKALETRLLDSLQVDLSVTSALLQWQPPYSLAEGLTMSLHPALHANHFKSGN